MFRHDVRRARHRTGPRRKIGKSIRIAVVELTIGKIPKQKSCWSIRNHAGEGEKREEKACLSISRISAVRGAPAFVTLKAQTQKKVTVLKSRLRFACHERRRSSIKSITSTSFFSSSHSQQCLKRDLILSAAKSKTQETSEW